MTCARERTLEPLTERGLDSEDTQTVFPHLADRLDAVGEDMREVFLVKAFLLLAVAHGDVRTVLDCLEEAATSGHARGSADGSL